MVGSRSGKQAKAEFATLQMKHGGTIRDEIHDRVKELLRNECAECCRAA